MKIIQLKKSDVEELQALACKTFVDTFAEYNTPEDMQFYLDNSLSLSKFGKELADPNSYFYGIRQDEKLIAYLKLNEADAQTDHLFENSLEIERIYVDKDFLGQGFGKQLFEFSVNSAKKDNKQWLWLGVWDQNSHAIEFYKRQGFIKYGEHDFLLGSDEQTDYLFKLPV